MAVLMITSTMPLADMNVEQNKLFGQEEEGSSVTLTNPTGGEVYDVGDDVQILFHNSGLTEILVELKLDSSTAWSTLGTRAMGADESSWWDWVVPNHPTTTAQIRVSSADDVSINDISDYFRILGAEPPENVTLRSPNGGESYFVDDTMIVEWNGGGEDVVDIWYAVSRGPWMIIERSVENTGSYDWVVPDAASDESQIKVCVGGEAVDGDVCDFNDDFFEILPRPPCTPLGWWDNNTVYDTRDTVLYPPPLAMAWVSLLDNNTEPPQESENGHDSWVRCNHRGQSSDTIVADFRSDFASVMNLAEAGIRYSFDGEDLEHLIGMDGTDVAGKEIVYANNNTIGNSASNIEEDDAMHQGAMNSIRNIRAGIWIPDVNGDLEFCSDLTLGADDVCYEQRVITGGGIENHTIFGVQLESVPPIVVSDCDEDTLLKQGVTVEHLSDETDGRDSFNESQLIAGGVAPAPQCGAVVTIAASDLPSLDNNSEQQPNWDWAQREGWENGIFNYIENDDDTFTLVYTYPGLTCDAFEVGAGEWESGTEGRATAIEYALIVALIAVGICDDVVTQIETIVLDEDDFSHIDDFTGGVTCTCNPGACTSAQIDQSIYCGDGVVSGVYVGKEGTDVAGVKFVITGGDTSTGGCWTDSDGLATWKDDCGEGDVSGVLGLSGQPPIVASSCDQEGLARGGVMMLEDVAIAEGRHTLDISDIAGILTGADSDANDVVLRGMACGAQVSVTIDGINHDLIVENNTVTGTKRTGYGIPNFIIDEENNQTTLIYSYPGMTCDAAGMKQGTTVITEDDGTDARDVGGHLIIESTGIVTCEDVVVEVEGPVNGSRSNIIDDECLSDGVDDDCDGILDADVVLSVGSVDVTTRDAVAVGGGVAGTSILWLAGRKLLGGA
jgi:hypothetical protein